MITSRLSSNQIRYVNRNDKKNVMGIATGSCEQLKRLFGPQNLDLARFTTVINNIQQLMYRGLDIDDVFINEQIGILLNNLPGASELEQSQARESAIAFINATIIMAKHNSNNFKLSRQTQTIKDFIRVLANKPETTNCLTFFKNRFIGKTPAQLRQPPTSQQLTKALITLYNTIRPCFGQFEAAKLLNININGHSLMLYREGIWHTNNTSGEMNRVKKLYSYSRPGDFEALSKVLIGEPSTYRFPKRSTRSYVKKLDTIYELEYKSSLQSTG